MCQSALVQARVRSALIPGPESGSCYQSALNVMPFQPFHHSIAQLSRAEVVPLHTGKSEFFQQVLLAFILDAAGDRKQGQAWHKE